MDGVYGFAYGGADNIGFGYFRITGGELIGADCGGCRYKGSISTDETGDLCLSLEMTVPPGAMLVQGTSPQELPLKKSAELRITPDFASGKPFKVDFAPGPAWIMAIRVSDDWSAYADGFSVTMQPSRGA